MAIPTVGLTEIDTLILRASEQGLAFPADVKRWALLAWAAEELELQRNQPTDFARGGFRRVWEEWFGPKATPR